MLRRALFRLNLPLMPRAQLAGFSARRRLLWIAAAGPTGTIEVFRFSDGRLQARVELGATIVGAEGHPDSPRLVVATRKADEGAVSLTELDFQLGERRVVTAPFSPRALCVVEGAQPALVLVDGAEPIGSRSTSPRRPRLARPRRRRRRRRRRARKSGASARLQSRRLARQAAGDEVGSAGAGAGLVGERARRASSPRWRRSKRSRSARRTGATSCATGPRSSSARRDGRSRRRRVADDSTLAITIARLALDERATRALQLLYGARLLGHAGVRRRRWRARSARGKAPTKPAGTRRSPAACSVSSAWPAHATAASSYARPVGRFLDGAPPRLTILAGGASDAELPGGNVRLDGGAEPLAQIGVRLAAQYGYDVALVLVDGPTPARTLATMLVEARLHGAWPIVDVSVKAAKWSSALDEGPTVVVARGDELPAAVAALPLL